MRQSATRRNRGKIVAAAAAGKSTPEIAKQVGVARETVWRALQDPETRAAVMEMRAHLAAAVGHKIEAALLASLDQIIAAYPTASAADARILDDRLFEIMERLQPRPAAAAPMQQPNVFDTTAARAGMTLRETMLTVMREKEPPTQ